MARFTPAEKQRRYREKRDADPLRRQEYLLKEKEKYKSDVKAGKKKHVANMTDREKRSTRKKWRNYKKSAAVKKKNDETPAKSNTEPEVSGSQVLVSRQKFHSLKTSSIDKKLLREENKKLIEECTALKKRCRKFERKARKLEVRMFPKKDCLTPESKSQRMVPAIASDDKYHRQKVRRTLKFHFAVMNELKSLKKNKQKINQMLGSHILRKYKLKNLFCHELNMRKHRVIKKAKSPSAIQREKIYVKDFFLRPDNSRILNGLKNSITLKKIKKQKRLLNDSLQNLYRKYVLETSSHISFTSFWRMKPFWLKQASESERNTCLCKTCDNIKLMSKKLFECGILQTANLRILLEDTSCSMQSKGCAYSICDQCKDKEIFICSEDMKKQTAQWQQWKIVKEKRTLLNGKDKEVTFTKKLTECGTLESLCDNFLTLFKQYKSHAFNMDNQFQYFRQTKQNLRSNEVIIHVDFAQNYVCKLKEEIQSTHFGASQNQITLHTGMYTTLALNTVSFCGVSDCLKHDPSSVWAFMQPVLKEIKIKCSNIDTAHFFSDGPCSQYRQKHNFYLFTKYCHKLGFTSATWNFFEAGHGKGAPDGIGSSVKQTADRQVKYGQDISCSSDFISVLKKANTSIKMYEIRKCDIEQIDTEIPQELKPVAGTMKLHQVIMGKDPNIIFYRDISCVCRSECEHVEHMLKQHVFKKSNQYRSESQSMKKTTDSIVVDVDVKPVLTDITCIRNMNPGIDPLLALKRFESCDSFGLLHHECEALSPYIHLIQGQRRALLTDKLMLDTFATGFTPKDLITSQKMLAVKVRSDGDCLPGCGSIFAFGKDDRNDLLRLLIIHELVLHADFYTKEENLVKGYQKETSGSNELVHAFAMYSDKFIPGTSFNVRKIFEEETLGLLKAKSYMGIWQLFALSSVLRMQIFSVYPQLGNPLVRQHLHRLIMPRVKSTSHIAFIMWTSTRSKSPYNWLPNHFVPLLPFQ